MKKIIVFLVIALFFIQACSPKNEAGAESSAVSAGKAADDKQKGKMDASIWCMLTECIGPMWDCLTDANCRAKLKCADNCKSDDPELRQACFIECVAANPDKKFIALSACSANSKCITPPDYKCPLPKNRNSIAPVTLKQMEGAWYVIRGLSRAYDCWSCQRMVFKRVSDTVSKYDYDYIPKGGKVDKVECTTTAMPFTPKETVICPGRFRVNYNAYTIQGMDDWFVLSYPNPKYMLIYYCGATPTDIYRGAIVMSRSPETKIPADIEKIFDKALADAGLPSVLKLKDFGIPDNSPCIGKK